MAVRLILSVVVGLALSLSPAAYAMKQLELKSHSHIAAIDIVVVKFFWTRRSDGRVMHRRATGRQG
ncbi:hypothetical protein, partial [Klebsiella pneumoniae]|uniref:hypothetical protein n=1 Tax=Klebsiella pneumoniae TaxID=573 RepID=UPI000CAEDF63